MSLYSLLETEKALAVGSRSSIAFRDLQQGILDRRNGVPNYLDGLEELEPGGERAHSDETRAYDQFLIKSQEAGFGEYSLYDTGIPGEIYRVLSQIPISVPANRVDVIFKPGRLGRYVPVSGDLPDRTTGMFRDAGVSELEYFCELFGARVTMTQANCLRGVRLVR